MDRITQLKEFLKEQPEDAFLNHALALEYRKKEEWAKALEQFLFNLRHHPEYIGTYYHLGQLYEIIGEEEKAITTYELGMKQAQEQNDRHAYGELRSVYEELTF